MHFIVIGGGLAGLAAATTLQQNGHSFQLLEKGLSLGGRVQSSHINGHIVDHGFQVYLPNYQEGRHFFDYNNLKLKHFSPGSLILYDQGYLETIGDPLRRPNTIFSTLFSRVGSYTDKLRLLKLRKVAKQFWQNPDSVDTSMSTHAFLVNFGFEKEMINHFFIPFFSGVFFDKELETSSAMFLFLYGKFASSLASVPTDGMGALSAQLAKALPNENIHLNEEVKSISTKTVQVASGKNFVGDKIILAAPMQGLLNGSSYKTKWQSSNTIYFESDQAPHSKRLVGIVSKKKSLINNISVMSNVSKAYAPKLKHQIAVSIFGSEYTADIESQIKSECKDWFGSQTEKWKYIEHYHVQKALPNQEQVRFHLDKKECKIGDYIYCAGDYLLNGSIDAALKSGRLAAEYAMQD